MAIYKCLICGTIVDEEKEQNNSVQNVNCFDYNLSFKKLS